MTGNRMALGVRGREYKEREDTGEDTLQREGTQGKENIRTQGTQKREYKEWESWMATEKVVEEQPHFFAIFTLAVVQYLMQR